MGGVAAGLLVGITMAKWALDAASEEVLDKFGFFLVILGHQNILFSLLLSDGDQTQITFSLSCS